MSISTHTRKASLDEIAAEMDRRGAVIEKLEEERDRYLEALRDIDSVGVDFGHYEAAARTMQEHAHKALFSEDKKPDHKALLEAAKGLRRIVEEIDGSMRHGTWRDDTGRRLKDSPEWVAFYNALSSGRDR